MSVDAKKAVLERLERIRAFKSEWAEQIAKGRRLTWELLGHVYVAGVEIDAKPEWRHELNALVDAHSDIKKLKRWFADEHSVFEVVLVGALGYNHTASKRHYYSKALSNAEAAGVPADVAKLADWLRDKDGIVSASKVEATKPARSDPSAVLNAFKGSLPDEGEFEQIEIAVEESDLGRGIGLLIVERVSETESRVVRKIFDPRIVASAIKQSDDAPTAAQLDRQKREALFDLNRVALKLANVWRGKVEPAEITRFMEAVSDLARSPFRNDYFDGEPEVLGVPDTGELRLENSDFHPFDPGRYIKNAKPRAMVPYALDEVSENKKEALAVVPSFQRWKVSRPRKRKAA